jgi:hypothetical protein
MSNRTDPSTPLSKTWVRKTIGYHFPNFNPSTGPLAVSHHGRIIILGDRTYGVPRENRSKYPGAGGVLVANHSTGEWLEILPDEPSFLGMFGAAAATSASGRLIAIGAPGARGCGSPGAGQVIIYRRGSSGYKTYQVLQEPHELESSGYGNALAMSEDGYTLAVGASRYTYQEKLGAGLVFLYRMLNGVFTLVKVLSAPHEDGLFFGTNLALSGNGQRLFVSYNRGTGNLINTVPNFVSTFAFTLAEGWGHEGDVTPHIDTMMESFGTALKTDYTGETVVISAPKGRWKTLKDKSHLSGWVKVCIRTPKHWVARYITPPPSPYAGYFGQTLSLTREGRRLLIGAQYQEAPLGQAYLYDLKGADWHLHRLCWDSDHRLDLGPLAVLSGHGSTVVTTVGPHCPDYLPDSIQLRVFHELS